MSDLKKKFCNVFFVFILFTFGGGSLQGVKKVNAQTQKITINADVLNIRQGPGLSFPILLQGKMGDAFNLLQQKGDWYEIQLPDGKKGWVASWNVSISQNKTMKSLKGTVLVNGLRVRSNPNLNSSILNTLQKNDVISIISENGNWFEITVNGIKGYVSKDYVNLNEEANTNRDSQQSKKEYGKVTVNQLNVRNSSSLNGTVIATVSKGEIYEILDETNNWVKIKLKSNEYGWIAGWFLEKSQQSSNQTGSVTTPGSFVTILNNGTNLRSEPNTEASILARGNTGDTFKMIDKKNDWYQIQLSNGTMAYVASWIVKSTSDKNKQEGTVRDAKGLEGKTIVLDPGHGGRDSGTIGFIGTLEKNITIKTAQLLSSKLKNAGANVIMTRKDDRYIPLTTRVSIAQYNKADAFISIHYDSVNDQSVTGQTSYYYTANQQLLAKDVHQGINDEVNTKDRGVRIGDFNVLRENSQPAVLLELGYLSNPNQEAAINTNQYQESITTGVYNGLQQYFK